MEFLSDSLQKVKAQKETMDKYNLFGVNMYLAGAGDALGQERKLDVLTASLILGESVEAMGFKKAQADSFADRFVEYLVADSRYMQMYQAGRNAMNTSLGGDAGGTDQLEKALAEWNKPKPKEEKAGPVTVMFTDMVGSTQLTQTRGDEVAQQVVRAHNRIVRDALNRYAGREIKHTGDGIMASFAITSNNLEAAVFIQRQAAVHTKANADLPLHLKIGINAGEPIVEDDDLFGTTVQVAARIVDKAKSEEIFVSEIVHGICAGKDFRFVNRGQFEMKGVQEPLTLYEAVWDESRVVEVAETEAEKAKAEGAEEPPEEEKPEEIAEEEEAPAADEKPKEPAEPAEPAAAKEAAPDEKPAEAAGEAAAPGPAAAPPPEAPKGSPEGAAKPQGAKVPPERETTAAPTAPPRQPAEAAKDKA